MAEFTILEGDYHVRGQLTADRVSIPGLPRLVVNTRTVQQDEAITEAANYYLVDSSAGPVTLTLPEVATSVDLVFTIVRSGLGPVILETAVGGVLFVLDLDLQAVQVVSDGSTWSVVGSSGEPTSEWERSSVVASGPAGTRLEHRVIVVEAEATIDIRLPLAATAPGYLTTIVRRGPGRVVLRPSLGDVVAGDREGLVLAVDRAAVGLFPDGQKEWLALMQFHPPLPQVAEQTDLLRQLVAAVGAANTQLELVTGEGAR